MDKLLINGSKSLFGEINISGAKNSALPIMCASLLTSEILEIKNIPILQDVITMKKLLLQIGVEVSSEEQKIILSAKTLKKLEAPYALVKTMRASILVLGPLLSRFGEVKVSLPGGCAIGSRPVDQHIKGLRSMGAEIKIEAGYIHAKAKKLNGVRIVNEITSVTGTENLLMAATLADGETILENSAKEPEVSDLAKLLVTMGAKIKGIGSDKLIIKGVKKLYGASFEVIPDRIEAGTFLCAVAASGGDVILRNIKPDTLVIVVDKLKEAGAVFSTGKDWIRIKMLRRPKPVSLRTSVYPGFPTDMQAQLMALNCIADGSSKITETIFENRYMHVQELNRLGASIEIDGHTAIIKGVSKLYGAPVMATDLRASASLVIAGLAAEGSTLIDRIYHLDRGYDSIEYKLSNVGAEIKRIR